MAEIILREVNRMTKLEIIEIIKLWELNYSNGCRANIDILNDILFDIENNCSFNEIIECYKLAQGGKYE